MTTFLRNFVKATFYAKPDICPGHQNKQSGSFILEIWDEFGLTNAFDLSSVGTFGDVNLDDEFGCFVVNKSGTKLAFVAEKIRTKAVPFFKASRNRGWPE